MNRNALTVTNQLPSLECKACGNKDRFIEIMLSEAHLVDGNLNYLHLVYAKADSYRCFDCGKEVAVTEFQRI